MLACFIVFEYKFIERKLVMRIVFLSLFIPAILLGVDFSDDFESFSEGDNISSSGDWFWAPGGGDLLVAVEGGDKIAETEWNGNNSILYFSPGSFSNGSVTAEVKFSGSSAGFGFMGRADLMAGSYFGSIVSIAPPVCSAVIAYREFISGDTFVLAQDYVTLNEDTWYTLSFEITGTSPVQLALGVNGEVKTSCQDVVYLLDSDYTAVVISFEDSEPMFYFDDYIVDDYATSLARTTFGGIKASFR